ncbi:tyrosine-type recombinase/integrase [Marinagarivorans cellulosilyticus]|uniref:tyrosine-type recombinase/integrase n=1 Tax=Marinagarivorans cellulosilyticus TaxID=2721545 RepID=UPI003B82E28F
MSLQSDGDELLAGEVFYSEWSHLTPHSLRHTRITHLVKRSLGLLDVQRFAGHEKLDTTAAYYH